MNVPANAAASAGAYRPPVGLGMLVSGVLHVAAGVALVVWRPDAAPPAPPVYRVDLVAAPPGPPRLGELAPGSADPSPVPTPPAPRPAPPTPPAPVPPAPAPPTAKAAATATPPKPAPPKPTPAPRPTALPKAAPPKPAAAKPAAARPTATARPTPATPPAAPTTRGSTAGRAAAAAGAGGTRTDRPAATSASGGTGRDPATVRVRGLDFPYPGYLANVVRQVAVRFDPSRRDAQLQADVAFLIHRDGSVTGVRVVRASGSYAFDLEAQGAIEAAGGARAFGPLPDGFRDDVLPVTFSFDPRVLR